MRGIERVLAAVLLMGAVGGAAAFARYAGTEPAPPAFEISASPRQHLTLPQTVVQIPLPAPRHVVVTRPAPSRPHLAFGPAEPSVPAEPPQRTPAPAAAPPVEAPPVEAPPVAAPPAQPTPAQPVAAPPEPRTLAAEPAPDPAPQPAVPPHGHRGKAKGHDRAHGGNGTRDDEQGEQDDQDGAEAAAPPEAAPPAAPVPPATPGAGENDENGEGHGNGDSKDGPAQGHGHGHAQGD
jgi:hypothetical protein